MELKIIDKKERPLLSRTEITAEISFEGKTPSKEEVKKLILNDIKTNEALVIIKKIKTYFGVRKATAIFYVYSSKEAKELIEPKGKKKKGEESEGEKKEEPKQELKQEPKQEAGKGDNKEETKKEGKKEEKQDKKETLKEEKKESKDKEQQ